MMTYDLPADLEEEILSRVPATSLKRVRSACKRWKALFKDRRFTEKHFGKAPKQSHVLMLKAYRLCSMSVDLNVVPPSVELKGALDLKDSHSNSDPNSEQIDIAEVFHCDGLLLLCNTKNNRLMVWNPCLGETRWIQHKNGYESYENRFSLGYEENNQSCRSYKILRFYQKGKFEIYELSSNSWRLVVAPNCFFTSIRYHGVTLKGNTYWISVDDDKKENLLLSFDFTRERFRRLCLPTFQNRVNHMALSVVREEELSVLIKNKGSYELVEMWVTKKIDSETELSWSKSFVLDLHSTHGDRFHVFTSLLIDEVKKVALCCDSLYHNGGRDVIYVIGEANEYYTETPYVKERWLSPYGEYWWPFIFNYVPSLVQIQSKTVVSDSFRNRNHL